jgi:hypothetical protein
VLPVIALTLAFASLGTGAAGSPADVRSAVAECQDAASGNPDLGTDRIEFAEYRGWADGLVQGKDGNWTVKMGAVVRGSRPVTVRVIPAHQGRAALVYGRDGPASQVRFEPCADHPRSTGWPGGARLTERRRFTVEIRVAGKPPERRVLLDKPRHLPRPSPSAGNAAGA